MTYALSTVLCCLLHNCKATRVHEVSSASYSTTLVSTPPVLLGLHSAVLSDARVRVTGGVPRSNVVTPVHGAASTAYHCCSATSAESSSAAVAILLAAPVTGLVRIAASTVEGVPPSPCLTVVSPTDACNC